MLFTNSVRIILGLSNCFKFYWIRRILSSSFKYPGGTWIEIGQFIKLKIFWDQSHWGFEFCVQVSMDSHVRGHCLLCHMPHPGEYITDFNFGCQKILVSNFNFDCKVWRGVSPRTGHIYINIENCPGIQTLYRFNLLQTFLYSLTPTSRISVWELFPIDVDWPYWPLVRW